MKLAVTVSFFLCAHIDMNGQALKGQVKDSTSGAPLSNVSVVVKTAASRIVGYSISDQYGKYSITVTDALKKDGILIEARFVGYRTGTQSIHAGKLEYDFFITAVAKELEEFKVQGTLAIKNKGDTLRYEVNSFARTEDRSIGDVISHMPGLSVDDKGEIFYNGKPVSGLYIQGDDLMDGRYGLATKAIRKDMIKAVDVLQNFQPVKVLKNKTHTDKIGINLILKDENSLEMTVQAMAGLGLPNQYDASITGLAFNKKYKMLNVAKANNSGLDYRDEFLRFSQQNLLESLDNTNASELVSSGSAGNPDLPRQTFYFNQSGLVNANNLYNTRDSLQLRLNLQGFLDKSTFNYSALHDVYLPADTVHYFQAQQALRKQSLANATFSVESNKYNNYLLNRTAIQVNVTSDASGFDFNGIDFNQGLESHALEISNELNWIPVIRNNNIFGFRWYASYQSTPQNLTIARGLHKDILNHNVPYTALTQTAEVPTLFSSLSASYTLARHRIKQTYEAGILSEKQKLSSDLELVQPDGTITAYSGDKGNDIDWIRHKVFANALYSVKMKKWQAGLTLPFFYQTIHYSQLNLPLNVEKSGLFFNPLISVKWFLNAEDNLSLNFNYRSTFGGISGIYRSLILTDFRTLSAYEGVLQESNNSGIGFTYFVKRSIRMFFMNAGIRFENVTYNSITSSTITDNLDRTVQIPFVNSQSSMLVSSGINKYFPIVRTKISLNLLWRKIYSNRFFNSQPLPYVNNIVTGNFGVDGKLKNGMTGSYLGVMSIATSRPQNVTQFSGFSGRFTRIDQRLSAGYALANKGLFSLTARQISNNSGNIPQNTALFADLKIRFVLRRPSADLDFDITNLFNTKEYQVFYLMANQSSVSQYMVRGRMAILRLTFNL